MSTVANKRELLRTTNELVKKNHPTADDFTACTQALSQVFTDMTGLSCRLVLKINQSDFDAAIKAQSKTS